MRMGVCVCFLPIWRLRKQGDDTRRFNWIDCKNFCIKFKRNDSERNEKSKHRNVYLLVAKAETCTWYLPYMRKHAPISFWTARKYMKLHWCVLHYWNSGNISAHKFMTCKIDMIRNDTQWTGELAKEKENNIRRIFVFVFIFFFIFNGVRKPQPTTWSSWPINWHTITLGNCINSNALSNWFAYMDLLSIGRWEKKDGKLTVIM